MRSIEEANEVINRYEREVAGQDWPGGWGGESRKPVRTGGDRAVGAS